MLRKTLGSFSVTYMTIIKSVKMSFLKFLSSRPGILYHIHKLVVDEHLNIFLLLTFLDIILQNF